MKALRYLLISCSAVFAIMAISLVWFINQAPNIERKQTVSQVIRAQDGQIINLRLTENGYWREPVSFSEIDPLLVEMLIAYEDKRFWSHQGVDFRAIARASVDYLKFGRIVSGASTLTMQTVRLIDPSLRNRTVRSKVKQMLLALRLERHMSKEDILEAYFTLAPYGGNIEGVKAATEAWFQKTPGHLTLNEAALLVALPQAPESRRPDKHPQAAFEAKKKVLERVHNKLSVSSDALISEVTAEPLPSRLIKPKSIAPHLADKSEGSSLTTISAEWQRRAQDIVTAEVEKYSAPIQAAALVVERKTGYVKAYIGSADYASKTRKGANNYLTARRSSASTLKPIIFAKALQRGLIEFNQIFNDNEFYRRGYNPTNFDNTYSGKVTLKDALLRSLNIPALITLEKIGPNVFENEISTFLSLSASEQQNSGLSLAVGGFYLSAEQLMNLYLASLDVHETSNLSFTANIKSENKNTDSNLLNNNAAQKMLHLLIQDLPTGEKVAFKTGTSHNRHDAWSVNIYEKHIVLAWLGTPNNESTSVLTGRGSAFPLAHEIGKSLGLQSPITPKLKEIIQTDLVLAEKSCEVLIHYPEDGSWIRSDDAVLSILGSPNADWYLNAEKLGTYHKQIKVNRPGVHKLTAKSGKCSQTTEVFVEFD